MYFLKGVFLMYLLEVREHHLTRRPRKAGEGWGLRTLVAGATGQNGLLRMPSLLPVPGTQDPGAGLHNGFILSPPSGSKQDLFTAAKRLIKMMKNPGYWGSPKMPPQCQQGPKSFPAFLGTPRQGAASAGVIQRCPEVRITHSSLLPTASTPQTVVLLASTQLVGTMGPSHKKEGPPHIPLPSLPLSLEPQWTVKESHRAGLKHRDTTRTGRRKGRRAATICLKPSCWLLSWMWPWPHSWRATSPKLNVSFRPWLRCPLLSKALQDCSDSNCYFSCLRPALPTPLLGFVFLPNWSPVRWYSVFTFALSVFSHVVISIMFPQNSCRLRASECDLCK